MTLDAEAALNRRISDCDRSVSARGEQRADPKVGDGTGKPSGTVGASENMTKIILTVASVYTAMIFLAVAQSGSGVSPSSASAEIGVNFRHPATSLMAARQP